MDARLRTVLAVAALLLPTPALAQDSGVKLAIGDFGLGIGDVRRLDGLRLNFRDDRLELVRGINATIWTQYEGSRGRVEGLALGVPITGAYEIRGIGIGAGVGAERDFVGLGMGGIGIGAGGDVRGIALGGIGVGAGGDLEGIMIGGVGAGAGGDIRGILMGGVGAGASGDMTGVGLGGVGLGVGGDLTGVAIGGLGVGAGGEIRGLAIGGVGVGAPAITGVAIGGFGVGGEDVRGLMIAPAYFNVTQGGEFRGFSVSAWNRIQGTQRGLAIGILNVADELHGLQVGVINIARNKRTFSVLPLFNYHP